VRRDEATSGRCCTTLMAAGVLDLVSFIQQRLGDEGGRGGLDGEHGGAAGAAHHDSIVRASSAAISCRCSPPPGAPHSTSGVRAQPGQLHDHRGTTRRVTFTMNPCGSGQRLRAQRRPTRGLPDGGGTREAHDWSFERKGFPAVLHALQLHERVDADPVVGLIRSIPATHPRITPRTPAPGTGTRTQRRFPIATGSATAQPSQAVRAS